MRLGALACLVFVSVVTTGAACSSVPDVTFSDVAPGDAGPDVFIDPNCKKTGPEDCSDGIDNDCNGLTDCADPACGDHICSDAPPDGWNLVAFASASPPGCPTGYAAPADLKVVSGDGTGGTCDCKCTGPNNVSKCSDATYSLGIDTGGGAGCGTTPGGGNNLPSNTGATCTALGAAIDLPTGTTVKLNGPNLPATCTGTTSKSNLPALTDGRQCGAPPGGKGCPGTQVCVPKPAAMKLCVAKPGVDSCPAAYAKRSTAGTSGTVDNRSCNACTCGPTTPCTGDLTLFTSSMCMLNGQNVSSTVTLGGACATLSTDFGNKPANAFKSNIAGGCGAPTGFNTAVSGSIAWANQETVCCKP